MTDTLDTDFVITKEYHRFVEFCDACREYRYVGLCYGAPGLGKSLSALRYTNWAKVKAFKPYEVSPVSVAEVRLSDTVFYTAPVMNTPRQVDNDLQALQLTLNHIRSADLHKQKERRIQTVRSHQQRLKDEYTWENNKLFEEELHKLDLRYQEINEEFSKRHRAIENATRLVIIDEADRLKMASLDQVRHFFDSGSAGLILIGMPGLEKRLARYPQFYSRVGFVHEFRSLSEEAVRELLRHQWARHSLARRCTTDDDAMAAIIRVTGGNFRLLHRLLTQIGRILEINDLKTVTSPVVDAARESLVIGTA